MTNKLERKPCACCGTTLGTAWNDRYCNVCEYWQGGRTTQDMTWDTAEWSADNLGQYMKYLQAYNIPYRIGQVDGVLLLHINN